MPPIIFPILLIPLISLLSPAANADDLRICNYCDDSLKDQSLHCRDEKMTPVFCCSGPERCGRCVTRYSPESDKMSRGCVPNEDSEAHPADELYRPTPDISLYFWLCRGEGCNQHNYSVILNGIRRIENDEC